jgi:hypothetical protein
MAERKNPEHSVLVNGGGCQDWRLVGLPGLTGPRSETSYMAPMADLLDRMHNRARQGAHLDAMCRAFPDLDRGDISDWMAANEYPRQGDGKA